MRQAWVILMRAARDILDNIVVALQISAVPILIISFVGDHWLNRALAAQQGFLFFQGHFVWWMWALGLAATVLPLLWMAVGWHRFVILGERPWPVAPRLNGGRILAYAGRNLVIILLAILYGLGVVFLFSLVAGIVAAGSGMEEDAAKEMLAPAGDLAASFLGTFFVLRFSPAVVATACGMPMTLREATGLGGGRTIVVLWLSLATLGIAWILDAIVGLIDLTGIALDGYVLVSTWFLILINVGIMTALLAESEWAEARRSNVPGAGSG